MRRTSIASLAILSALSVGMLLPNNAAAEQLKRVPSAVSPAPHTATNNETPILTSISPAALPINAGPVTISIVGNNFVPTSVVQISGADAPTTFISSTQLRATLESQSYAKSLGVWVSNPQPGGGASNIIPLPVGITNVASLSGGVSAAAIDGSTAYVSEGRTISVLNLTNEAQPTKIGSIEAPGKIHNLELVGSKLYAAIGSYGFVIIDVSTPTKPAKLGSYITAGSAYDLAVSGNTLYLADGPEYDGGAGVFNIPGLSAFDISNPSAPKLIGRSNINAYDIDIAGNTLYVTGNDNPLMSYDISDPTNITLVNSYVNVRNVSYGVRAIGNRIYVTEKQSGLHIIDTSAPSLHYWAANDSFARDVDVDGNRAYVVTTTGKLIVLDVTDLKNIQTVGTYSGDGNSWDVRARNGRAYLLDGKGGMKIFDVSQAGDPVLLGQYGVLSPKVLAGSGTTIAVASDTNTFSMVDISNPTAPTHTASIATVAPTRDVVITGTLALVAEEGTENPVTFHGEGGALQIFDTSTNPPTLKSTTTVSAPLSIAIEGTTAFIGTETGIEIYSFQDAEHPQKVAVNTSLTYVTSLQVGKGKVYASNSAGLSIFDVHNLNNWQVHSQISWLSVDDMKLQATILYIIQRDSGKVLPIDVSNPDQPKTLNGMWPSIPSAEAQGIDVVNGKVYVAETNYVSDRGSFSIFDMSDPANPKMEAAYRLDSNATDVYVQGDYAYVATPQGGLQVLRIDAPATPPAGNTIPATGGTFQAPDGGPLFTFGAGTFNSTVTLIYSACAADAVPPAGTLIYGGVCYDILAITADGKTTVPQKSYTVSITGVEQSGEQPPALYWWDGGWQRETSSSYDAASKTLTAMPSHFSTWGVLSGPTAPDENTIPTTGGSFQAPDGGPLFTFAAGTFASTVTLSYSPCAAGAVPPAGALIYGGVCYDILATTVDGKTAVPQKPYTVSITGVEQSGEQQPALYWWDGDWQRETSSSYDAASKTLTAMPSHFSTWGVLSSAKAEEEPNYTIYIPMAVR
ncbi:hypothetical protein F8S13_18020 [Chloroflexia bacterium SDU3-3]|nr:hypothetical protein F8S13_18020 [Chloroflexia bacterium SDU3-3]